MGKISASILSADFMKLGKEIALAEAGAADYIHVDVMDGNFVPLISLGSYITDRLSGRVGLPLDVHIMAVEPERHINSFATDDTEYIVVHYEAVRHLHRTLEYIRSLGKKNGVALNPATDPRVLDYVIGDIDQVLVMSVNPGFGGQRFIPSSLRKLSELRSMREEAGAGYIISIDGGVYPHNALEIFEAGADMVVSGSGIFAADDPLAALTSFRSVADRYRP
ncbi:MAG: ribulose-phosphate 3-epimerase [Clostridiales Family XIII bacterium]|jgi:ribulose-phosphate 3-epimerase|nr:ribulose-phosphate 3-epimerase [Clostridiales Family XIII bacterium]